MLSKFPKLGTGEERARERFGRRDLTFGNSPVMILLSLSEWEQVFPAHHMHGINWLSGWKNVWWRIWNSPVPSNLVFGADPIPFKPCCRLCCFLHLSQTDHLINPVPRSITWAPSYKNYLLVWWNQITFKF